MTIVNKILFPLAILSVIVFLLTVFYIKPIDQNDMSCYNPDVKIGFTKGLYQDMTDCEYNGNEWECDQGTFKYCH
jgi:hypothetical protein